MSNALANGDRVEIRGLCSIFVKQYKGLYWQESQDRRTQAGTTKETTLKCGQELKERVHYKQTKTNTKKGG